MTSKIIGFFQSITGKADSVLTTKGDLATYSTTRIREAVGTNNKTLMADSAQATGIKWAASSTSTLTTAGDLLVASGANALTRLARGSDNQTLMMDGTSWNWETASAGDEDLAFIEEVTLSGGANVVIEKTSGLDDYETVIVIFNLWKGGGTDFVPQLQTYSGGALDTSFGLAETITGATASTAGASIIPVDGNTTADDMCSGSITIRTESTLAQQTLEIIYQMNNVATSNAPVQGITSVQTPDDSPIQGIRFSNGGTNTPLFGNTSYLLFYGVKKVWIVVKLKKLTLMMIWLL